MPDQRSQAATTSYGQAAGSPSSGAAPMRTTVTLAGSGAQHAGGAAPGGDQMTTLLRLIESVLTPISAVNQRLSEANARLLDPLLQQIYASERNRAEHETLIAPLSQIPDELTRLRDRLSTLEDAVRQLELAAIQRAGTADHVRVGQGVAFWQRWWRAKKR